MEEQRPRGKFFGEYMEERGICTAAQLERALGYASDCAKWGRYIPIGQALVELGYTTQDKIDEVLHVQARDRGATPSREGPQTEG